MFDVTFQEVEPVAVVGLKHSGSYHTIGPVFESLFDRLAAAGALSPNTRCFGVYYDDPALVPEPELHSMACATAEIDVPGLVPETLAGGEYAVLRYQGPYQEIQKAYDWFFGVWLPESGREPAYAPVYEHYVNDPREVAPENLLTDIYLLLV